MILKDNAFVKVFNYNPFILSVGDKLLEPCYDYNAPSYDLISTSSLAYINSNTTAIRNGLIRFDKAEENEIYKELNITKSTILFNEEIEDILVNPTKEKLQRLVGVTDISVFDRIYTIHTGLINSGQQDISNRVTNIIEARLKEFRRGILTSQIQLVDKDAEPDNEVEKIRQQNFDLQKQLDEMKLMMSQLLEKQETPKNNVVASGNKRVGKTTNKK